MLFDKTGTLTQGRPALADVIIAGDGLDGDELLRLAASLDQVSPHILASAIVDRRHASRAGPADADSVREVMATGWKARSAAAGSGSGKASWIVGGTTRHCGHGRCADAPTWTVR